MGFPLLRVRRLLAVASSTRSRGGRSLSRRTDGRAATGEFDLYTQVRARTPEHLGEIIDWLGWDRLIFSSDYPHWDFDHPRYIFKFHITPEQRAMVLRENAKAVYGYK